MGEAIEGIHADREEDRQKLIDILVGSNMELTGNESMDTLLDLIDMSNLDLSKVVQVACGSWHVFVLYSDGTLYSCGRNESGQLGLGNTDNTNVFVKVNISDVKQIACASSYSMLIKNDGTLWACGYNSYGQLGLGGSSVEHTFKQVTVNGIADDVSQISCSGNYHSLLLKTDGSVWSSGNNSWGQLGLGDATTRYTFNEITTMGKDNKQVACTGGHSFILKNNGKLYSCGNNSKGQLGLGDITDKNTFNEITSMGEDNKQVDCGNSFTMVVKNNGDLYSCGNNGSGQLGLGTTDTRNHATWSNVFNGVKFISCGDKHTMAIKDDGSLWACGDNDNGRLGLGDTNTRASFTQVTINVDNDIKYVDCGMEFTFMIKNDGRIYSCGYNSYGQLGLGHNNNLLEFTAVSEAEALRSQIQSLNVENTTNRGNLTQVLADEGVSTSNEDDMASLITKVDEEFDRQNNEININKQKLVNILMSKGFICSIDDDFEDILNIIRNHAMLSPASSDTGQYFTIWKLSSDLTTTSASFIDIYSFTVDKYTANEIMMFVSANLITEDNRWPVEIRIFDTTTNTQVGITSTNSGYGKTVKLDFIAIAGHQYKLQYRINDTIGSAGIKGTVRSGTYMYIVLE